MLRLENHSQFSPSFQFQLGVEKIISRKAIFRRIKKQDSCVDEKFINISFSQKPTYENIFEKTFFNKQFFVSFIFVHCRPTKNTHLHSSTSDFIEKWIPIDKRILKTFNFQICANQKSIHFVDHINHAMGNECQLQNMKTKARS